MPFNTLYTGSAPENLQARYSGNYQEKTYTLPRCELLTEKKNTQVISNSEAKISITQLINIPPDK